jgi:hypothetical protein
MYTVLINYILEIKWVIIIDWILRLVGLFTLTIGVISIFIQHYEFDINVFIDRIFEENLKDHPNAIIYIDEQINGEYILFLPNGNTNFKKVKYCSLKFTGKRLKRDKVLQCFYNINCTNGLIINSYYSCGAPARMIEWAADYGGKGTYVLAENGKDGHVILGNHFYRYGFISNIRQKLGWK